MSPPAIVTSDLSKLYGDTEAVVGLDLTVDAGEIFGFLGPNGAGKTTTIGMLCTLLRPSLGAATVAGYDVTEQPLEVRRRIGVVFQEPTLDTVLTARENLRFQAALFLLGRHEARAAVAEMLELMDLTDRADTPVAAYSGGMRRRLEIARGMLHAPGVLFLDEPTTGLDPQTRAAIWGHLHRMRETRGVTIFLTTHHLEEAEHCDRLAIIDHGELVAEGRPEDLKCVVGADLVVLRTSDDHAAVKVLRDRFSREVAEVTEPDAAGLRFRVAGGAAFVPRLCAELTVPVLSVTVTPPTLDDVFLRYTGRTIREIPGDVPGQPSMFAMRR